MTLQDFLGRLQGVKRAAGGWQAKCPAHDDRSPSLSVKEGDDGRILVKCHGPGCEASAIASALGLRLADLFSDDAPPTSLPPPLQSWEIRDADGTLVATHHRQNLPGGKKKLWWERHGKSGLGGLPSSALPLYGSERVKRFDPTRWVYLTEGEKACDALRALGVQALATVTGASGTPSREVLAVLRGLKVTLWPDHDEVGAEHMVRVERVLTQDGGAPVRLSPPNGLPPHGDAVEWIEREKRAGRTGAEIRELLESGALAAPGGAASSPAWGPVIPFETHRFPPFPVAALPSWLGDFVLAVSNATQTPPDLAGMLCVAALATACARRIVAQVRPGYREPVNLFIAVAMEPGNRKSAVFSQVQAPIEEYERELIEQQKVEVAEKASAYRVLERALERAEGAAAKADPSSRDELADEARHLARELAGKKPPVLPRLLADDATPERLASLLNDQGGRLAVLSPEGGLFDSLVGRYTTGAPNLDVFLKGHTGDALRVDRVGRAPEHIPAPALTVGLAVQPDILHGLLAKPALRGRGILARFLYALPESLLGRRAIEPPPVPDEVALDYRTHLRFLLALPTAGPEAEVPRAVFSPPALAAWLRFAAWLEPQLGEGGELSAIKDWAGKLAGAVARLSVLLHAALLAPKERTPWEFQVGEEAVERAALLGRYLLAHARGAFAEMASDARVEGAKKILAWLQKQRCRSFRRRELFRGLMGSYPTVAELEPLLELLVLHEAIRVAGETPRPGPGRPPSPLYEVNPEILGEVPAPPGGGFGNNGNIDKGSVEAGKAAWGASKSHFDDIGNFVGGGIDEERLAIQWEGSLR